MEKESKVQRYQRQWHAGRKLDFSLLSDEEIQELMDSIPDDDTIPIDNEDTTTSMGSKVICFM